MIKTTHVVDLLPAYAMNTISDEEVTLVENQNVLMRFPYLTAAAELLTNPNRQGTY